MALHYALILLEGETEEEFYKLLSEKYLDGVPKRFKQMHGNFNVNKKILDGIQSFSIDHPASTFDVYLCLDQDRRGSPVYNRRCVLEEIVDIENCLAINDVIAELMIESLFFIDIDGLYKFLRAKKTKRNPRKFSNFRIQTHRELDKLFQQFGKTYIKGHKVESLVQSIDLEKISSTAEEISSFLAQVHTGHDEHN